MRILVHTALSLLLTIVVTAPMTAQGAATDQERFERELGKVIKKPVDGTSWQGGQKMFCLCTNPDSSVFEGVGILRQTYATPIDAVILRCYVQRFNDNGDHIGSSFCFGSFEILTKP